MSSLGARAAATFLDASTELKLHCRMEIPDPTWRPLVNPPSAFLDTCASLGRHSEKRWVVPFPVASLRTLLVLALAFADESRDGRVRRAALVGPRGRRALLGLRCVGPRPAWPGQRREQGRPQEMRLVSAGCPSAHVSCDALNFSAQCK